MKNSMKRTALLLAAILLLSACGVQPSVTTKEETTAESVQEETTAENTREETEKPSAAESTGQTEPASETVTESAAEETAAESPSEKVDEPTTDDPTPYEESSEETPEESESETAEEPPLTEEAAAYHAAVREGSYTLAGELSLTRTIGEESYVTKDSFHMNIRSEESESPSAAGELTHSIKGAGMEAEHGYQLFYGDGKGTLLREGAAFTAVQTLEDFLFLLPDQAALTPLRYENLQWEDESHRTLVFSGPVDVESGWLGTDCTGITMAEGKALLDEEGKLSHISYQAAYELEGNHLEAALEMDITAGADAGETPVLPEKAAEIESLKAVVLLDAAGAAFYADRFSARTTEFYQSNAAGQVLLSQQTWALDETQEALQLREKVDEALYDANGTDMRHTDLLQSDGVMTYTDESGKHRQEYDGSAFPGIIRTYLEKRWPASEGVETLSLKDTEDCWLLEFTMTEEFGRDLRGVSEEILFEDAEFLEGYGAYTHTSCEGALSIDKGSGLPLQLTITNNGNHQIGYMPAQLLYRGEISLTPVDAEVYQVIYDEPAPTPEPENPATPLFYQVTDPEGHTLWLLGTIHVGDSRTAHLPQIIYDKLLSADALAVEADVTELEKRLDEDEDLLDAYLDATYYSDGKTVYDHLESEELKETVKEALKKYGGGILVDLNLLKAVSLQSYLEQDFVGFGRQLSYDRGVDYQLIALAKKNGIEVRDVEDYLNHVTFTGNFSDALQELLLKETLEYGRYQMNLSAVEMFDLWCEGDEDTLRQYLEEEEEPDEDLTEEEKALEEEYNQAMMAMRNNEMINRAKEYLEKGETVFFAVGLAHLLGEDGLVDMLRAEGYSVEAVSYQNP
ncbi:MAG: TraB/GumN family protein [Lachnospiraceae bacterium]|nr:TraB/GumN family protein [Lachnospiraceae bacterium]